MLSQRIWGSILSACAATVVLGQQILIENRFVLAQNTSSSPIIYPATWTEVAQQRLHSNAESACKVYEGSSGVAKAIFNHLELYNFAGTNTVAGATCYLDLFIRGSFYQQYTQVVKVGCLKNGQLDYNFVYSGGPKGVCVLASIANGKNLISPKTDNDPLEGTPNRDIFILTSEKESHDIYNFDPRYDEIIIYNINYPISYDGYPVQPPDSGSPRYGTIIKAGGKTIASVPGANPEEVKAHTTELKNKDYVDKPL